MWTWHAHQRKWLADKSRFRIAIKARQIGWSTVVAREAIEAAFVGRTTVLGSASQRQSAELMRKVAAMLPVAAFGTGVVATKKNESELLLNTGGRIISIPSNPNTVVGFTGDVVLDEFARTANAEEVWAALFPTISSNQRFSLSVVSTPRGMEGKFHSIVSDARTTGGEWSLHQCDIHQAIAGGCKHNVEQLRAACDDEQVFRQEFLCEFVDEAHALLPYELIQACVDDGLDYEFDASRVCGYCTVGMDIGRVKDLTVICVGWDWRGRRAAAFIELKRCPYREQREALDRIMRLCRVSKACIDSTGIGAQLAEDAAADWGHVVEPVAFTAPIKEVFAGAMVKAFSGAAVAIAPHDPLIHDLHSVSKSVTIAGNVRYAAPREHGSHADRFWAMALMLHAACSGGGPAYAEGFARRGGIESRGIW